ncbi:hypothetical protein [Nocardia carnea]|uniref:hypothetical protein n=1 Tax=Nocardia carnea TaxID=37328 RepID=UPI002456D5A4|nr:hypothetical protein [Nocardia carnea]
MDGDERQVWELSVELGPPEATGPGALDGEGIHPVALLLEESVQRIRGANRIPCFTAFGQVTALNEFAQRAWGEAYNQEDVPVECRLAVYVTDEELDDLTKAIVEDLGLSRDGFSTAANRKVIVGLHPISLEDPENSFYHHLVNQYESR